MIETYKLDKSFGYKQALRKVSFRINAGEVVLLAGPNGAGKTTLLRILATLSRPTQGKVVIDGLELPADAMEARARVGYVGHQTLLYDDLSVAENLRYYARLYGLTDIDRRVREVSIQVGVEKRQNDAVRTLSRGYQQRVALARALLHNPSVYLYDEPWTGLDQNSSSLLTMIFEHARATGAAVLFSSHEFERSANTADRALILHNGKLVYDGMRSEWGDATAFSELYAERLVQAQEEMARRKRGERA